MIVFLLASLALLVGLVAALILGRLGDGSLYLAAPTATAGGWDLPEGDVGPEDVDDVWFDRALRGYRMDQVDAVLARLRTELETRDTLIVELSDAAAVTDGPR